jgi:glycine/D-amino acid oxidase-like deaminating enzyme
MQNSHNWGRRPWTVDFGPAKHALPGTTNYAVVGGGFTGLAAAAWLKKLAPDRSVALFERGPFGAGSSGYTGGVALAESAGGDLPGLGDVLAGYQRIMQALQIEADLELPGCYELARTEPLPHSPIRWRDSGTLCATKEVPGGTINPGKVVSGLARAAEQAGALLFVETGVEQARFADHVELRTSAGIVRAKHALFATNAFSLELTGILGNAEPAFTTAVMTEPLDNDTLGEIGLGDRKPFYTVDLPYLWGRLLGNAVIFGCGLIFFEDWRGLDTLDIEQGEAPEVFDRLEKRVRGLHPMLREVKFTHRWGGPICIAADWKPIFRRHPQSENALVLGAYSGHGVALSAYLGAWAAEVLLGKKSLPNWT